jgi:hypothetical protein
MKITKGSGSVRDSLVGLIVPGLLITTLVGVLVVKWRPAQATEPAPLPPGTLTALHRAAVIEAAAEGEVDEAFLDSASRGRVGDPGGVSTARDDLSRAASGSFGEGASASRTDTRERSILYHSTAIHHACVGHGDYPVSP